MNPAVVLAAIVGGLALYGICALVFVALGDTFGEELAYMKGALLGVGILVAVVLGLYLAVG